MTRRRDIVYGHPYFPSGDIDTSQITLDWLREGFEDGIAEMQEDWNESETVREKARIAGETGAGAAGLIYTGAFFKTLGGIDYGLHRATAGAQNLMARADTAMGGDALLDAVSEDLTDDGEYMDGLDDVRRATIEDVKGENASRCSKAQDYVPTRAAGLYRDIVAELDEPLDLDTMETVMEQRGYDTGRTVEDGILAYGQPDHIEQLDAENDAFEQYHFTPDTVYTLGGHVQTGVTKTPEQRVRDRADILVDYLDEL